MKNLIVLLLIILLSSCATQFYEASVIVSNLTGSPLSVRVDDETRIIVDGAEFIITWEYDQMNQSTLSKDVNIGAENGYYENVELFNLEVYVAKIY